MPLGDRYGRDVFCRVLVEEVLQWSSEKQAEPLSGAASGAAAGTAIFAGLGHCHRGCRRHRRTALRPRARPHDQLIDIPSVVDQARTQARQNALDSIALEREADPATANLRLRSNDFLPRFNHRATAGPELGSPRCAAGSASQGAAGQSLGPGVGSAGRNGPVEDINGANAAKRDSPDRGLIKAASNKDPSAESLSREARPRS